MTIDENMIYFVRLLDGSPGLYAARPIVFNHGEYHKWEVLGLIFRLNDNLYPQDYVEVVACGRAEDFVQGVGGVVNARKAQECTPCTKIPT